MHRFPVFLLSLALCLVSLAGCQKALRPTPLLPDVKIGVVGATQPMGTSDLLAGFIPEQRTLASEKDLVAFNESLVKMLSAQSQSKRNFTFVPAPAGVDPSASRAAGRITVLRYWVDFAKRNGFDLLIVPQILNWHEREGSAAGVVSSAEVDINFYLIDARGEGELLDRSHYSEKQAGLAENLLSLDTFLKRGGKWLTAQQLADEATRKMIQEFGL